MLAPIDAKVRERDICHRHHALYADVGRVPGRKDRSGQVVQITVVEYLDASAVRIGHRALDFVKQLLMVIGKGVQLSRVCNTAQIERFVRGYRFELQLLFLIDAFDVVVVIHDPHYVRFDEVMQCAFWELLEHGHVVNVVDLQPDLVIVQEIGGFSDGKLYVFSAVPLALKHVLNDVVHIEDGGKAGIWIFALVRFEFVFVLVYDGEWHA